MLQRLWICCKDYGKFFYKWLVISWQMLWGIISLSSVNPPRVTFFGGVKLKRDDVYAKAAFELAAKLAKADIAVITGGGPGLMEAANCGAQSANSKAANLGITVRGLEREVRGNMCSQKLIVMEYFFARKWLLISYSTGFVVFPGGFGTMDEFAEVITLIQTNVIKQVPVILFGVEYWKHLIDWMKLSALDCDLISQKDIDLLTVTDDVEHAFKMLSEACKGECLLR
jgi:uncharacterized protein (TIGR00730 family)